jgi:endo-beta-N-acetylglucosaminidase D
MKTAVEWLIDEHFGGIENCTSDFRFHIQQAKEMEKEQIKDAWYNSLTKGDYHSGDEYYNETFKQ